MTVKAKHPAADMGKRSPAAPRRAGGGVVLSGDLVVDRAVELREVLLQALGGKGRVVVGFRKVGRVDLSFLQLLCALHRSALKGGREFSLSWRDLPAGVREEARSAGFPRRVGCGPGCLWIDEG